MACGPRKRSDMSRSRWRTAGGVLADPRSTGVAQSRSSGNSARTSPSTQPSARTGSWKSSSSSDTPGVLAAGGQRVEFAPQVDGVGLARADEGLADLPTPRGERDLGADGHVVEVGQHAVAVVADREPPPVGADRAAQVVAVALDGHGGELDPRIGPAQALERVELVDAAPAARGDEGEHDRPALGELADVEDLRAADLAGVALPRRRALRLARRDVGVAVQRAGGQRRRERRELVADGRPGRALGVAVVDRVERDVAEREHDDHADEPAVAAGAGRPRDRRLAAHARRRRGRLRAGTRRRSEPRSASTSTAGSTTSTPSSDTVRSTTVTQPKSRSMRMSETARTAKPAIAVAPDASTAAPVERYVRSSASPGAAPATRSWR